MLLILIPVYLFLVIWTLLKMVKEDNEHVKTIQDAHKAEQTTLDPHELDAIPSSINIRWKDLGLVDGEPPYAEVYHRCN